MKYTAEEEYAIGYYMDKEICAEIEIEGNGKDFLEALGITEDSSFESHLIRFKTLLNLIEKQRKEIEEKDELLKFNKNYINRLEQDLYGNASNYVVPKEKIREKIKELSEEDRAYTDELLEPDSSFKIIDKNLKRIKNQTDILEEILGDE